MLNQLLKPLTYPARKLISWPLLLWTKARFIQEPKAIETDRETYYLLARSNLTEPLLLEHLTKKQQLPAASSNRLLFLEQAPPWWKSHLGPQTRDDLYQLWQSLQEDPERQVQVIPVSFYWGRAPGREEPLVKILTADTWAFMGGIRRFLTVILHGRQLWVEMGAPLNPREVVNQQQLDQRGVEFAAEKSLRLLRLYFRRARTRILGPDLSHRRTQRNTLMASAQVREALAQEAKTSSQKKAQDLALRYFNEIASNVSYPVLLVLDRLLSSLWNRLYDGVRVTGLEQLRDQAGQYTLVYLPCHRSHIDYLLLSYLLFKQGLMPPHIAAGINLNMPLIGPLLRRGGAFFMRRSFKDNPLYSKVFNEYLYQLYNQGHPVEFFIEGGRSRTGRTLPPRPGLLAMTLKAAQRGTKKPLLLIPVYVGYEKVLEGSTYLHELKGKTKKKESPLDLLRMLRSLKQEFGQVDVSFGQPLALEGQTLKHLNDLDSHEAVAYLGLTLATRINQAATLNRVNLVAVALLASSHRALEADNLQAQLETLSALAGMAGVAQQPAGQPQHWIETCEHLGFIERLGHPLGPIYRCDERQGILLTWYRNNILHLFALPSLVAFLFINQKEVTSEQIYQQAASVYPLLAREFFLPWNDEELNLRLLQTLNQLAELGLLEKTQDGKWQKPAEQLGSHMRLRLLAQLVQPTLERIYLLLGLLEREGSGELSRDELVKRTQQMAQRLTLLQGLNSPEFADSRLFEQALELLIKLDWLQENTQAKLTFDEQLVDAMSRGRQLFDPQLRHRLLSLTAGQSSPLLTGE
ncbi:glycerol-3-phosphate acyltransferase [Marinospirillum celere]|uniref:Glycerol-3-phosphate acyltransferase n=1 Tax=Marinospirillum celere TaxID=1122252 RepID=A0A1I1H1U1_9GAMM|nr:glycerol-3-phosphate 1-O-acyltransferase PlsB [Marinospirillum celere]SFC16078.1 glycerol-3-phosphate acyltransferase [Marinospirillum celere]